MSMSFKASPDGTYGEILVNGQAVAKLPVTGNAVIPGLVGTVSQSGGIPTGAVVERGSNANGDYVRFADGTQICIISVPATAYNISTAAGSLFRSDPITASFPAAFAGPVVTCFLPNGGSGTCWGGASGYSSSSVTALLFSSSSGNKSEAMRGIIIGRWF